MLTFVIRWYTLYNTNNNEQADNKFMYITFEEFKKEVLDKLSDLFSKKQHILKIEPRLKMVKLMSITKLKTGQMSAYFVLVDTK